MKNSLIKIIPLIALLAWPTVGRVPSSLSGSTNINCSGNLVNFPGASHKVFLLTNGHCIPVLLNHSLHLQNDRLYVLHYQMTGQIPVLTNDLKVENLHIKFVSFATMLNNDIALIEMVDDYEKITSLGIKIYEVDRLPPAVGDEVEVISGYWKESYLCKLQELHISLVEGIYHWPSSLVVEKSCLFKSGISGSPFISTKTRKVVGIANTLAEKGILCSMNSPCEISAKGIKSFRMGGSYGQHVHSLYNCFDAGGDFSLEAPNCDLATSGERLEIKRTNYL